MMIGHVCARVCDFGMGYGKEEKELGAWCKRARRVPIEMDM